MSEEEIIRGCTKHDSRSQQMLYELYCGKMMSVCIRYTKNVQEARDLLLMGFKNVFGHIRSFADKQGAKGEGTSAQLEEWIKKEVIAAAAQHMHNSKRQHFVSSTVSVRDADKKTNEEITDEKIMQTANADTILKGLQQLTPLYRTVYNMHEVDGYSHPEISKILDVGEYISKDSLSKAKFNLRKNIGKILAP